MKTMKVFILIAVLLSMLGTAQAQGFNEGLDVDEENKLVITLPTKNDLGNGGQLESIALTIRGDTVSAVGVQYKSPAAGDEKKDLDIGEGTQVVGQGHSGPRLPFIPNLRIMSIHNQDDLSGRYGIDQVRLYPDSTVYVYTRGYKPHIYPEVAVKYTGDVRELENDIAHEIAGIAPGKLIDSILVYEAFIYGLDSPSKISVVLKDLVYGKPSEFSWITRTHLTARKNNYFNDGRLKWEPLERGNNVPKTTKIRISATLNPDGSVTVQLP